MNERPPTLNYEPPQPPKPWLSQADREAWGCLGACVGAVFTFVSLIVVWVIGVSAGFAVMQRVVVSLAGGANRYAAGVRVVGKSKMHLSDGTPLGYGWQWVYVLGVFLCMVLVMAPYIHLLQKFGLLKGDESAKEGKSQQEP